MNEEADGYELPLFTSITEPILMAGVHRSVAISLWTVVAAISIPLALFWIAVPIGIAAHAALAWFTSKDPHFFEIMKTHIWQKSHWDC